MTFVNDPPTPRRQIPVFPCPHCGRTCYYKEASDAPGPGQATTPKEGITRCNVCGEFFIIRNVDPKTGRMEVLKLDNKDIEDLVKEFEEMERRGEIKLPK